VPKRGEAQVQGEAVGEGGSPVGESRPRVRWRWWRGAARATTSLYDPPRTGGCASCRSRGAVSSRHGRQAVFRLA